jgi:hypothetical protein
MSQNRRNRPVSDTCQIRVTNASKQEQQNQQVGSKKFRHASVLIYRHLQDTAYLRVEITINKSLY